MVPARTADRWAATQADRPLDERPLQVEPVTARAVQGILDRWVRRMGLERWKIELELVEPSRETSPDEWADASIWRSNAYETAKIQLHPTWRSWSAEEAETHLVHELVHLWTRDMEEMLSIAEDQVTSAVFEVIRAAAMQRTEATVDLISRRLIAIAAGA
jgi:hypothetical protein